MENNMGTSLEARVPTQVRAPTQVRVSLQTILAHLTRRHRILSLLQVNQYRILFYCSASNY